MSLATCVAPMTGTATSSEAIAQSDPEWFDKLAFPVLATGASFRTGMRFSFF